MDSLELMKGVLLSPAETFRKVSDADLNDTLKYYLILLLIAVAVSVIMSLVTLSSEWSLYSSVFGGAGIGSPAWTALGLAVPAVFLMIALGVLCLFIAAAWLHLWVYILGGSGDYLQTLKACAFGGTPAFLFGWLPLAGFIAVIWSCALLVLGLRELHLVSTGKALEAVLLAVAVVVVVVILLGALFFIASSEVIPAPVTGA